MRQFSSLFLACTVSTLVACGGSSAPTATQPATTTAQSSDNTSKQPAQQPSAKVQQGYLTQVNANSVSLLGQQLTLPAQAVQYAGQNLPNQLLVPGFQVQTLVTSAGTALLLKPDLAGYISHSSIDQFRLQDNQLQAPAHQLRSGDFVLLTLQRDAAGRLSNQVQAAIVLTGNQIPLQLEMTGAISELQPTQQQFRLNGQTVSYAAATTKPGLLQNGRWVEVKGQLASSLLIADSIEAESLAEQTETEIGGVLSWISSDLSSIELNQRLRLQLPAQVKFSDGNRSDLQIGKAVEVSLQSKQGEMLVTEIDFSDDAAGPNQAKLDKAQSQGRSFQVITQASLQAEQLHFRGFAVQLDANSSFEDGLTPAQLAGQWLKLEGVMTADGRYWLKELEKAQSVLTNQRIELKGLVQNNTLWGYPVSDQSLLPYEGQWQEFDCHFDGNTLSACVRD